MYTCANCDILACASENKEKIPKNCPMRQGEMMLEILKEYAEPENHDFYVTASSMEAEGYGQWSRLKETMMLCKKMGYKKIGIAFCKGLRKEARVVARFIAQKDIIRKNWNYKQRSE